MDAGVQEPGRRDRHDAAEADTTGGGGRPVDGPTRRHRRVPPGAAAAEAHAPARRDHAARAAICAAETYQSLRVLQG